MGRGVSYIWKAILTCQWEVRRWSQTLQHMPGATVVVAMEEAQPSCCLSSDGHSQQLSTVRGTRELPSMMSARMASETHPQSSQRQDRVFHRSVFTNKINECI